MKRSLLFALLLWPIASAAWSMDQIYLVGEMGGKKTLFGQITATSPTKIVFTKGQGGGGDSVELDVNEVERILFENSPGSLTDAQKSLLDGDYDKAVNFLRNEKTEDKRPDVAQEILYTRAFCAAKSVSSEDDLKDAARQLSGFIAANPNSFHYFRACELMGDLCAMAGKFEAAEKYYGKLGQAPWPDFKIRALVALGRTSLLQENEAAAEKAFDEAINIVGEGDIVETQRAAARIGKARCDILKNRPDAAIAALDDIIGKLDKDAPVEIVALAYNARGTALRKAGKLDKATLDFLHVHLMYDSQQDAHAEALANLVKLFTLTHKAAHAKDMREILERDYGNSRWSRAKLN